MNNNFVTAETAARLKAAGFPQPEPEPGQVWYIEWALYIIRTSVPAGRHKDYMLSRLNSGCDAFLKDERFSGLVFAPGVADLLLAIGFDYALLSDGDRQYIVYEVDYGELCRELARTNNPAEALAAAWLELHEKK